MAKKLETPIAHQFGTIEYLETLNIRSEDYEGLVQLQLVIGKTNSIFRQANFY